MSGEDGLTLAKAVHRLFGVQLSKHEPLRMAATDLLRCKIGGRTLFEIHNEAVGYGVGGRNRVTIDADQLTKLHNALILQGIFTAPKVVFRIFTDLQERKRLAAWARELLVGRHEIVGIEVYRPELQRFLAMLDSEADLERERLPNPFVELPQLGLDDRGALLQRLAAQTALLPTADSMMINYLNGDLEAAWREAKSLATSDPLLQQYQLMVLREFQEAKEFDALLDELR